jgi:pimeloyl-ACP methyl ester carboxylesterase
MKKLLFISGLLSDATLWQPIIEILKPHYDCQVVSNVSHETIIENAQALWGEVTGKVVLIGFSLGAWIALQAQLLLPARCESLVLISSAPGSLTTKTRQHFLSYIEQIQAGDFDAFIQADLEQDVSPVHKNNLPLRKIMTTMMTQQGSETALRQFNAMLQFAGDFSDLSYIKCPTLLMRGSDDQSVNRVRQEKITSEITQAELITIPQAAHYIPLENPTAAAAAIHSWLMRIAV